MPFKLSNRSIDRLEGVHPDLQKVVKLAIELTEVDFGVTEGVRSIDRQRQLYAGGASKTMNSRHIPGADGLGKAIDLAAYIGSEVRWDWPLYHKIATAMKRAANALGVAIVWGGDWRTFKDGPHFELDRREYP
jgi:peptidoglycan LD-endopeptidase CwlK